MTDARTFVEQGNEKQAAQPRPDSVLIGGIFGVGRKQQHVSVSRRDRSHRKLFTDFGSAAHPFTLLPLLGQLLLAFTLLQKVPSRMLTFLGLAGVGVLLAFMFIIGVLGLNVKIALSVPPFLTLAFMTVKHHRANKAAAAV